MRRSRDDERADRRLGIGGGMRMDSIEGRWPEGVERAADGGWRGGR